MEQYCQATRLKGQRVRVLNPMAANDRALLEAVARGEFTFNGFRNGSLRPLLFCSGKVSKVGRPAAVTRQIRLLRAHGLIRKVQKSLRSQATTECFGRVQTHWSGPAARHPSASKRRA